MSKRNLKKITKEELYNKIFKSDFFLKIKNKFPYRDYEYQFELMCDWWESERDGLPKSISAFNNWLSNTQPDEVILTEEKRIIKQKNEEIIAKKVEEERCKDASKFLNDIRKTLSNKITNGST